MHSVDALFSELGGPSVVGRLIGKSTEHAAAMKRRKSIPVRYWPKLIQGATGMGVLLTEARLLAAHQVEVAA